MPPRCRSGRTNPIDVTVADSEYQTVRNNWDDGVVPMEKSQVEDDCAGYVEGWRVK